MTLVCKPRGRGNWKTVSFSVAGEPDMSLLNCLITVTIDFQGMRHSQFWVRKVLP